MTASFLTNFLVVHADNFDNFLDDNDKAVLVTMDLTTIRQSCVLYAEDISIFI